MINATNGSFTVITEGIYSKLLITCMQLHDDNYDRKALITIVCRALEGDIFNIIILLLVVLIKSHKPCMQILDPMKILACRLCDASINHQISKYINLR